MKKLILTAITIYLIIFTLCFPVEAATNISKIINKVSKGTILILEPDEVTEKILSTRKDKKIVIEICYGTVTNNRKDGKILNTKEKKYNYISYKGIKKATKGKKVVTFLVYDNTNYEDDVAFRIDKVL